MKCKDCHEHVEQAEVNAARDIRENAGLPRTGTICLACAQERIDQQEVQEFRAAFGGLEDE
jgi:RNase P subunit RPR2